jgi:plastocyanin
VIAFILVVAAYSHFHTSPEVVVMTAGFAPQTIEIPEGTTIHFVNRSSTITQILCLGNDQRCDRSVPLSPVQSPPPRDLLGQGVRIGPDQAKDVVFDTAGIFDITSAVVPGMNLTVKVDATD